MVSRRYFIKQSGIFALLLTGLTKPLTVLAAWSERAFAEQPLDKTMLHLFGTKKITETAKIKLKAPRIAENGTVVPVKVNSDIENIDRIYILVEKNPVPLIAQFDLSPAMLPSVSARLKMAETSDIIVVVRADNKLYSSRQSVKVTIGGCGG